MKLFISVENSISSVRDWWDEASAAAKVDKILSRRRLRRSGRLQRRNCIWWWRKGCILLLFDDVNFSCLVNDKFRHNRTNWHVWNKVGHRKRRTDVDRSQHQYAEQESFIATFSGTQNSRSQFYSIEQWFESTGCCKRSHCYIGNSTFAQSLCQPNSNVHHSRLVAHLEFVDQLIIFCKNFSWMVSQNQCLFFYLTHFSADLRLSLQQFGSCDVSLPNNRPSPYQCICRSSITMRACICRHSIDRCSSAHRGYGFVMFGDLADERSMLAASRSVGRDYVVDLYLNSSRFTQSNSVGRFGRPALPVNSCYSVNCTINRLFIDNILCYSVYNGDIFWCTFVNSFYFEVAVVPWPLAHSNYSPATIPAHCLQPSNRRNLIVQIKNLQFHIHAKAIYDDMSRYFHSIILVTLDTDNYDYPKGLYIVDLNYPAGVWIVCLAKLTMIIVYNLLIKP